MAQDETNKGDAVFVAISDNPSPVDITVTDSAGQAYVAISSQDMNPPNPMENLTKLLETISEQLADIQLKLAVIANSSQGPHQAGRTYRHFGTATYKTDSSA